MKREITEVIREKSHSANINSLKSSGIKATILEKLTFEFLESIAAELTGILREKFIYTGNIESGDGFFLIVFTSSSQSDKVTMKISFNDDGSKGFEFDGLNDKLEKIAKQEPTVQEVPIPQPKPTQKSVPQIKIDPNKMIQSLTKQVQKEDQAKKEEQVKNQANALIKAISSMEEEEEVKKKVELLDNLIDKENE